MLYYRPLPSASAVVLELPESLALTGGYTQQYRAVQLHLHWGSPSGPGSEHTVNGRRFPAEVRSPHGEGCIFSLMVLGREGAGMLSCFLPMALVVTGCRLQPLVRILGSSATVVLSVGGRILVLSQTHAEAWS